MLGNSQSLEPISVARAAEPESFTNNELVQSEETVSIPLHFNDFMPIDPLSWAKEAKATQDEKNRHDEQHEDTETVTCHEEKVEPVKSEFVCEWQGCHLDCSDLKTLVGHVNQHVANLGWTDTKDSYGCQWTGCWNPHSFNIHQRMVEHLRSHTLEKPYMCPVKSCRVRFSIRSNCLAHGRTRHNRSVKPLFLDINQEHEEFQDDPAGEQDDDEEEEFPRSQKRKQNKYPNGEKRARRDDYKGLSMSHEQHILREIRSFEEERREVANCLESLSRLKKEHESTKARFDCLVALLPNHENQFTQFHAKSAQFNDQYGLAEDQIAITLKLFDAKILPSLKSLHQRERALVL